LRFSRSRSFYLSISISLVTPAKKYAAKTHSIAFPPARSPLLALSPFRYPSPLQITLRLFFNGVLYDKLSTHVCVTLSVCLQVCVSVLKKSSSPTYTVKKKTMF